MITEANVSKKILKSMMAATTREGASVMEGTKMDDVEENNSRSESPAPPTVEVERKFRRSVSSSSIDSHSSVSSLNSSVDASPRSILMTEVAEVPISVSRRFLVTVMDAGKSLSQSRRCLELCLCVPKPGKINL